MWNSRLFLFSWLYGKGIQRWRSDNTVRKRVQMSPCKYGFQACTAYSKCGLTRVTYSSFHSPSSLPSNVLLSMPIILFSFPTIRSTCPIYQWWCFNIFLRKYTNYTLKTEYIWIDISFFYQNIYLVIFYD